MGPGPQVLQDLARTVLPDGGHSVLRSGILGAGVLVGPPPVDLVHAWAMHTPRHGVIPSRGAVARAGLALDMAVWLLRPRRLVGLMTSVLRVGRSDTADVVISHQSISKVHARIHTRRRRVAVVDAGSANGTFVNGTRIPPDEVMPLMDLDRLQMGSVSVVFVSAEAMVEMLLDSAPAPRDRSL